MSFGVFAVFALLFLVCDGISVSVTEGDSVTLHTDVKTNQDRILWYFNDTRIAQLTGNQSEICTYEPCDERFKGRLKVDSHTGDLTITNIRNALSGFYQLMGLCCRITEKTFSVNVQGLSAAERDENKKICVKEGESATLHPGEVKTPFDLLWCFNDVVMAEITGDQSQICTDVQCDERFRDRLKLNHQTGSLTITNTRNTDSGEYKLKITFHIHAHDHSITSVKSFCVDVIDQSSSSAVPGPGLSSGAVAGIVVVVVVVLLVAVAVSVIYYIKTHRKGTWISEGRSCDLKGSQQHQGLLSATVSTLAKPLKDLRANELGILSCKTIIKV